MRAQPSAICAKPRAALCASPQIAYARDMPVTTLFATRVYSKSLMRGRTDNLNARLLRECRALSEEDGAGIANKRHQRPGIIHRQFHVFGSDAIGQFDRFIERSDSDGLFPGPLSPTALATNAKFDQERAEAAVRELLIAVGEDPAEDVHDDVVVALLA